MLNWLENTLFPAVLNMSLTASVIILVVLIARLALRRAPRVFSYALWSVVLFRLLCPVSVSSALSLFNLAQAPVSTGRGPITVVNYVQPEQNAWTPGTVVMPGTVEGSGVTEGANPGLAWPDVLLCVWILVAAGMLLWALVAYLSLRVRLWDSRQIDSRVYVSARIDTAFVSGFVLPRIYLPQGLTERERECVLAHERRHIRRCDHIIKPLAYIALCLHWFNPLVWLAWVLAMRDMETSCDEAAIKTLGQGAKADYAQTLLNMATGRRVSLAVSLSFGDDTKRRIKLISRMKPDKRWIAVLAAVLCVVIIAACAANPSAKKYASVNDYAKEHGFVTESTYTYLTVDGEYDEAGYTSAVMGVPVQVGEVINLASSGTLEAWTYNVGIFLDPEEMSAPSAEAWQDELGNSFHLRIDHLIYALKLTDGQYEILSDRTITREEAASLDDIATVNQDLYNWYVENYGPLPTSESEVSGAYESVNEYIEATASDTVSYYTENGVASAPVNETQIESTLLASIANLNPDGNLQAWECKVYYKLDVPLSEVVLVGGQQYIYDGWYYLEPGRLLYTVQYPDGSFDVLNDQPMNDTLAAYGGSASDAMWDWYVVQNELDIPLCYVDWKDELDQESYDAGNFPARRYDGDGWYVYIPTSGWYMQPSNGNTWNWFSEYVPEASFSVTRIEEGETVPSADPLEGYSLFQDVFPGTGCTWLLTATWPTGADAPDYAASIPKTLRLMADSFRVDPGFWPVAASIGYKGSGWGVDIPEEGWTLDTDNRTYWRWEEDNGSGANFEMLIMDINGYNAWLDENLGQSKPVNGGLYRTESGWQAMSWATQEYGGEMRGFVWSGEWPELELPETPYLDVFKSLTLGTEGAGWNVSVPEEGWTLDTDNRTYWRWEEDNGSGANFEMLIMDINGYNAWLDENLGQSKPVNGGLYRTESGWQAMSWATQEYGGEMRGFVWSGEWPSLPGEDGVNPYEHIFSSFRLNLLITPDV